MTRSNALPLYIQLTDTYAPAWGCGGPVRLMFDYGRWLSRDFQVTAYTSDVHHDFTRIPLRSEIIDGVSVRRHRLFFPKLAKRSIYLLSPSMFLQAARQIYRSGGPAVVHFVVFRGLVPIYAMLLRILFGKRVALVHSAFGSLYFKRAIYRQVYDWLFMKQFVRLVDLRLAQNQHESEAYEAICRVNGARGEPHIVLFPLHLDGVTLDHARFTESGKSPAAVREARKMLGIPEDAIVFLFLGRLHPSKGILRTIDAYLEFSRSCSRETLLLIVGHDHGFQNEVEQYISGKEIQSKVRIINNVYETRFDYYFLADLFLGFPTIFEETMLASLEAMACGTPILVSREADVPFVEEDQAGRVIDFDVSTAAAAMGAIAQDLESFQKGARGAAAKHFDGAAASTRLSALLSKLISGNTALETFSETEAPRPGQAARESPLKPVS